MTAELHAESAESNYTGSWDCAADNCITHSHFGMNVSERLHPVFYDRSTNANTPNVPGSTGGKPFHVKDVNVASSLSTDNDIFDILPQAKKRKPQGINAEHIRIADQFVEVPGGTNSNNYANVQLILEIAEITHVDAVWPGWGHASENPELPDALKAKGIIFLRPPAVSMTALGDKIGSSLIAQAADVPTLPWSGSHVRIPPESSLISIPNSEIFSSHHVQPPEDLLTRNPIDKFLDDPNLCEDKLSEEARSEGFFETITKTMFPDVGGLGQCNTTLLRSFRGT
ncbi:hypothetical protein KIW84_044803 [Lathyrus oleraceus]|uniref:Biotin carboxylation domain-containing protein n=1 Tax=Pisum sativum TaxID=3888 RepID=A0A9D4XIN7_PEA|nr:hypothetical protein KIW84_044803 [Pisum sativum]